MCRQKRSHMNPRSFFVVAIFLGLLSGLAVAQVTTGTITGFITDPTNAAVPGATIVATQAQTGIRAQTSTSSAGNYVLPNLAVGAYDLTVTISGFKTWTQT